MSVPAASPEYSSLLEAMRRLHARGHRELTAPRIAEEAGIPAWTARRMLGALSGQGHVQQKGQTRGRLYWLPIAAAPVPDPVADKDVLSKGLDWSPEAHALSHYLALPISQRAPVTYRRAFVEDYTPNVDFLLGQERANALHDEGAIKGQFPAGTYLRKVLDQLLVDLAWSSSNLEGNTISYLDTERLFALESTTGEVPVFPTGADAQHRILLINHKRAINFLAEQVPDTGLSIFTIRNLHALLMEDLVPDVAQLGAIRKQIVSIGGSTYTPTSMPQVLAEMLEQIVEKAGRIKNPVEAAFFLWVNIAYLQPFIDGNKRTSRLSANIPLMMYNCSPLSFMDVEVQDYNRAMQGIYESTDTSIAADLFVWLYRRSIARYGTVTQAMGSYDPDILLLRPYATSTLVAIVRGGKDTEDAIRTAGVPEHLAEKFNGIIRNEIAGLSPFNSQRHGLAPGEVESWKQSRPSLK